MASSGHNLPLLEPKEEPLDEFIIMTVEKETVTQSAAIMKEEVKEEGLDLVDSFPVQNKISNLAPISPSPVKKEPEEYIQDLVGLGLIPAWDAVLDQSARYGMPTIVVEKPKEEVKEEDDSSIEQPLEFADDFEPALKKSRPNSKDVNGIMPSLDMPVANIITPKLKSTVKEAEDGDNVRDEVNGEPIEVELQSKSVMKKLTHMKNDIELKCPKPDCKFNSRFVRVWIRHLKKKHSTTLVQEGLILRCKCGNESQTGAHIVECNSTKNCVIRVDQKITGDLECPECEFRTKSIRSWIDHLKSEHSTTPQLAGLALLCECGRETLSDHHRTLCFISNFTIIRKREGPIRRLDDMKDNPQCILCDAYPKTVSKYTSHLRHIHASSLKKNHVYIMCACGFEVHSESSANNTKHTSECAGLEFTLHHVDVTTPQCVLCEAYPPTSYGYASHIQDTHKSTFNKEGIFLTCSCGTKLTSCAFNSKHRNECDGLEFSLHKMEDKGHSTPQCILCEAYPSTAFAYPRHLRRQHKSTLVANGLSIRCGCGKTVGCANPDPNHRPSGKCDGRKFALHKLEEKVTEVTATRLSTNEKERITISNGSLLEPKEEPVEYSMSVENQISQPLFMGVDNFKKEELIDDEEVLNLPPSSSPVKDEPIVNECVQDLVRFGQ